VPQTPASTLAPRALILAAGRGERMRPLSDTCPKPLLRVRGRPLIEWHLEALAAGGVREVVINTAWLEEAFPAALGDGARFGLSISYSAEGRDHGGALETAGGIATALPRLAPRGDEPFWVVSGDVFAPGFEFAPGHVETFAASDDLAAIWLVPNPPWHAAGDFAIEGSRAVRGGAGTPRPFTYANLALVRPALVAGIAPGTKAALGPLLFDAAHAGRLAAHRLAGEWHNVGTPEQLAALG
jgi:MurNAc alpha-1-phosphate uridylyltransferase